VDRRSRLSCLRVRTRHSKSRRSNQRSATVQRRTERRASGRHDYARAVFTQAKSGVTLSERHTVVGQCRDQSSLWLLGEWLRNHLLRRVGRGFLQRLVICGFFRGLLFHDISPVKSSVANGNHTPETGVTEECCGPPSPDALRRDWHDSLLLASSRRRKTATDVIAFRSSSSLAVQAA